MQKSMIEKMRAELNKIRSFVSCDINTKPIYDTLTEKELLFIAENKIYADNSRYHNKDELNESLANPPLIDVKIKQINKMFEKGIEQGCINFLAVLLNDIKYLEQTYLWGAHCFDGTQESTIAFWEQAYPINTIDNASAMCFASDTWEFYIFELILEKLYQTYPLDKPFDYGMLTAGLKDVRTKAYEGRIYLKAKDEIKKLLSEKNMIGSDGIMPLFLIRFEQEKASEWNKTSLTYREDLSEEFSYWFEIYSIVYECKILYEAFEYFGKYEFLRHFSIMKTYDIWKEKNLEKAQNFRYLASTYQYDKALEILKK